ncbi:hypothetical protein LCGC14_1126180 [marine sediment metagenome]|uniref:Uncharacterized protein n=1 Tax=marine sediment metagenome TaxID=412755 RepID=A0A0F9Q8B6_9ZZZZ
MPEPLLKAGYHEASYEDESGRKFAVLLPPGVPDEDARMGIMLGPIVDLADVGLPLPLEIRLHNGLFSRRIFTYDDARRRPADVHGALMAALKIDAVKVIESYHVAGVD